MEVMTGMEEMLVQWTTLVRSGYREVLRLSEATLTLYVTIGVTFKLMLTFSDTEIVVWNPL